MAKLFGTDGVRGKAGEFLDANTALKLAQSVGIYFKTNSKEKRGKMLLGKDTRRSGYMIENALVSGLTSVGFDVIQIGPMPTPAIAYLTQSMRCDAGIMLSASHNPYDDNGVKFFNCHGDKLTGDIEKKIEDIFQNDKLIKKSLQIDKHIGKAKRINDVIGRYIVSIKSSFPINKNLEKLRIVLDCANGAGYLVAPTILEELGAELIVINNTPDGFNINENCGAMYPQNLAKEVKKVRADIGIALDGDADRVVIVDENGDTVDGDKLIGALAVYLKQTNKLISNNIVATVMSNKALELYLKKNDMNLIRCDVGDKHVLDTMKKVDSNFGGEQSGHVVFKDFAKTGDGLVTSLQAMAMMIKNDIKASQAFNPFELSPQIVKSFTVIKKTKLKDIDKLNNITDELEKHDIRSLIRYSGTENKIRVLIEGDDREILDQYMFKIEKIIKETLC
ncbi:MAG: phosphoglucosamine mutase [Campylobacteraceae bacterium 4484_166]|nr:MAG: phosphoglucosamine mutase [Campylobacteraceae bacterium 4484_166]